jgi:hypothetical protein
MFFSPSNRGLALAFLVGALAPCCALADGGLADWDPRCSPNCTSNDVFGNGSSGADGAGNDARADGDNLGNDAASRKSLGDRVDKDMGSLDSQLADAGTGASSPAAADAARNAILDKPYNPPEEYKQAMRDHGLSTNRDLHEKGPDVRDSLYQQSRDLQRQQQQKYASAARAKAAAAQMAALREESARRVAGRASDPSMAFANGKVTASGALDGTGFDATGATSGNSKTQKIDGADSKAGGGGGGVSLAGGVKALGSGSGATVEEKAQGANDDGELHSTALDIVKELEAERGSSTAPSASVDSNSLVIQQALDASEQAIKQGEGGRGPASTGDAAAVQAEALNKVAGREDSLFLITHRCINRQAMRGNLTAVSVESLMRGRAK